MEKRDSEQLLTEYLHTALEIARQAGNVMKYVHKSCVTVCVRGDECIARDDRKGSCSAS